MASDFKGQGLLFLGTGSESAIDVWCDLQCDDHFRPVAPLTKVGEVELS
jgi:hypothetical protein